MAETAGFTPATHPYRWALLGGVWLIYFCFGLTAAALAPLVQPITQELGLNHSAMGAILGAWPLVYIVSAIPCGALLDAAGARRSLLLAALLIGLSGVLRGLAEGPASLFLAVAVFGLGGPLISIGAPKLIGQWFEGGERGFAMGVYVTGPGVGGIVALALTNGAMMGLTGGDWRAVLFAYAGFVLACGGVWWAITAHGAARAVERRAALEPRLPQLQVFAGLLRLPSVRIVLAMSIGIFFFNHGLNNWLPEMLRSGGMSLEAAGYWASIPTAVGIAGALVIPRLALPVAASRHPAGADRLRRRRDASPAQRRRPGSGRRPDGAGHRAELDDDHRRPRSGRQRRRAQHRPGRRPVLLGGRDRRRPRAAHRGPAVGPDRRLRRAALPDERRLRRSGAAPRPAVAARTRRSAAVQVGEAAGLGEHWIEAPPRRRVEAAIVGAQPVAALGLIAELRLGIGAAVELQA